MNVLEMNCVEVSHTKHTTSLEDKDPKNIAVQIKLAELVRRLSVDQPTWQFKLFNHQRKVEYVEILQDGQLLGSVAWRYLGYNQGYGFFVTNERIANQMARGNGYKTTNIDKAATKIKKMFKAKSLAELATEADTAAQQTLAECETTLTHTAYQQTRVIQEAANKYVMGAGFDIFLRYVHNEMNPSDSAKIKTALDERTDLHNKVRIVGDTKRAFANGDAVVITRADNQYICGRRTSDTEGKLKTYTDADLPDAWRGKLGMLKLVEPKHYIENVGGRMSENTFVVLDEQPKATGE